MIDIRSLTCDELEELMQDRGLQRFRGRQLFKWLWKNRIDSLEKITEFSVALRQELADAFHLYDLKQVRKLRSSDGTVKWAFGLPDGLIIETVLIPERSHSTLCVSTQVGCAMGCRFCLTGRMGFHRNLNPAEIACQALEVRRQESAMHVRNIVFMGMGEPLANLENLLKAIDIMTHDLGMNFSSRRITVSTSGIAPRIIELGESASVGLAISLHATTNEQRDVLMPVNRTYPLETLMDACRQFRLPRRKRITFEYLLLRDINDSAADARRLSRLLKGIPSKINLIPFNEYPGLDYREPAEETVLHFQEILKSLDHTVIIRKSKGRDIAAACGQLFHSQGTGTGAETYLIKDNALA